MRWKHELLILRPNDIYPAANDVCSVSEGLRDALDELSSEESEGVRAWVESKRIEVPA